jgi:myo-inositol-1(or 4)-monophosphatase
VLGAIHQPLLNLTCVGDGQTCALNGAPVRVRQTRTLAEATLLTTSAANDLPQLHSPEARQRLLSAAKIVRTWGDCFGYLLVATGRADIMAWPTMPGTCCRWCPSSAAPAA